MITVARFTPLSWLPHLTTGEAATAAFICLLLAASLFLACAPAVRDADRLAARLIADGPSDTPSDPTRKDH